MSINPKKGAVIKLLSIITALVTVVSMLPFQAKAGYVKAMPVTVIVENSYSPIVIGDLIDDTAYVSLRTFCQAMDDKSDISWDEASQTAYVNTGSLDLSVTVGEKYLIANGRYLYLENPCYVEDDVVKVPLRVLAKAFDAAIYWNSTNFEADVTKGSGAIKSGDKTYNAESLYWLSRIISAEARGESLEGQIAVGNVVLNRLNSGRYPDTVYGVVFDRRSGIQFSPTANGTIYREPTPMAVIAAKLALDGAEVAGGSLYFLNVSKSSSRWIVNNCNYVTTIGAHSFYM